MFVNLSNTIPLATNKHAQIRYNTLDKCFRNPGKRFAIEDLVAACNEAIYEFTGKEEGIKKRQLYDDIRFMESEQGWSIELEKTKEGIKLINEVTEDWEQVRKVIQQYFRLERAYYSIQDFTNLNTLSYLLSITGIAEIPERFDSDGKWQGVM